jgi:hypothetical protein
MESSTSGIDSAAAAAEYVAPAISRLGTLSELTLAARAGVPDILIAGPGGSI